jgi:hypothetical protein
MKRLASSATAVHRKAGPITILAAYRIALNEAKNAEAHDSNHLARICAAWFSMAVS